MAELVLNGSIIPIKKEIQVDYYNTFLIAEDLSYYSVSWRPDPNIPNLTEVEIIAEMYGNKKSITYWMQDQGGFPWGLLRHYESVELERGTVSFYRTKTDRGLREFLVAVTGGKVVAYNLRRPDPEVYGSLWERKVIKHLKDQNAST